MPLKADDITSIAQALKPESDLSTNTMPGLNFNSANVKRSIPVA